LVIAGGLLSLWLLANIVLFFMARSAASKWEQLASAIRGRGEPLTYADIMAARSSRVPFKGSALAAALEQI
jgi:hypothetical protein